MANLPEVTADNFESEVVSSEIPVLVDFWAEWCGPCRRLGPVVEEVAQALDGKLKVMKLNVENEQELAVKFGVASIPTIIFFKGGEIVRQEIGFQPADRLQQISEEVIGS